MVTHVREAAPDDIARLEAIETAADALLVECFAAVDWPPAESGEERASMPGFILVAAEEVGGPPIGFAHVLEITADRGSADGLNANVIAHLEQLAVLPDHGRRGHGRALVDAAMAESVARGHHTMTLRTYADVPWNAPFYQHCGFDESEPETAFHRRLVEVEDNLQLDQYGGRIQMTATLSRQ